MGSINNKEIILGNSKMLLKNNIYNGFQSDEEKLRKMTIKEAREYIKDKEFSEGSMLPKVEACIDFASKSEGYAIITSLKKARSAIDGKCGTIISKY